MGSMSTSAKQIERSFDVHLPDNQTASGVDVPGGSRPSDSLIGESLQSEPAAQMAPIVVMLLSPNLRAAVAIGFFLAYLATALT